MKKKEELRSELAWLKLFFAFLIYLLPFVTCCKAESPLDSHSLSAVIQFSSYKSLLNFDYSNNDYEIKKNEMNSVKRFPSEKVFQIEPSDAIHATKYSQPAVTQHNAVNHKDNASSVTVPTLNSTVKTSLLPLHSFQQHSISDTMPNNSFSKSNRDSRFVESPVVKNHLPQSLLEEDNKTKEKTEFNFHSGMSNSDDLIQKRTKHKNNFSNDETNMLPVSSDTVLTYQIPNSSSERTLIEEKSLLNVHAEIEKTVSGLNLEKEKFTSANPNVPSSSSTSLPELKTETEPVYTDYNHIQVLNFSEFSTNVFNSTITPSIIEKGDSSSGEHDNLSPGTVAGIVITVLVCVTLLSSSVIYLLYRKYNGRCTSVVESKFNSDNCGYLDDSLRSSIYFNNHIELPKESSEEMSSLDNDSFLNSLETMTFQNYWADNSKNTKV